MKHVLFVLSILSCLPAFAIAPFVPPTNPVLLKASADTSKRVDALRMAIAQHDRSTMCLNGGVVYANLQVINALAQQAAEKLGLFDPRSDKAKQIADTTSQAAADIQILERVCGDSPSLIPAAANSQASSADEDVLNYHAQLIKEAVKPFLY